MGRGVGGRESVRIVEAQLVLLWSERPPMSWELWKVKGLMLKLLDMGHFLDDFPGQTFAHHSASN